MIKQQQHVFEEVNMSNLTSAASGEASVSSSNNRGEPSSFIYPPQQLHFPQQNQSEEQPQPPPAKKKRNLPGNPDPDAEVIALSPKSLLATNRFVCEICNKGFQRDQNLQLHRRGHNLPWKLKQRTNKEVVKKVYVCPEPSCVHHDPSRALGDLTGIKKHFCRKHGEKKWKCDKCSKRYAVQSDWKAHSKVCGTREYRCDCGTLFSRRDSFITHRAFCDALAEETARAITTNSLLSNPVAVGPGPSTSQFINLQQQQQLIINSQQQDPLRSLPLKREQHQQQNLMNLPPWLACSPMDPSPSSTSSIFHHQDHQQNTNPSNPSMGPTFPLSSGIAGPYHTQLASPHMSATALLQKAAQMGATITKSAPLHHHHHHHHHHHQQQQQQSHVSDTLPNTTTTSTTTAGFFGLNLSSRDHLQQEIMSTCTTNTTTTTTTIGGSGPNPGPSSASFIQDMMMNSLHEDDAFGIGGMAMLSTTSTSKKNPSSNSFAAFHQTFGGRDDGNANKEGKNDGLTRDFLGLRPLSHSEILTIAGFGNGMNTTSQQDHQQDNSHKPWQV